MVRRSLLGKPCVACGSDEIAYRYVPMRDGVWGWSRFCAVCEERRRETPAAIQRDREVSAGLPVRLHPEPDPAEALDREALRDRFNKALATLTYREREIIKLRWGLGGDGLVYTLNECSEIFKVTRERVRQIEARAIRKLQHPRRAKMIAPELVSELDEWGRQVYVHQDSLEHFRREVDARRKAMDDSRRKG